MTQIQFTGPVDVSPELAIKLFESLPEMGQQGVASLFASRLTGGQLSEAALRECAKIYFERCKIPSAAARSLREGVQKKAREIGESSMNPEVVRQIIDDETRKSAKELIQEHIPDILASIPVDRLVQGAAPAVHDAVRELARHYFLKTQEGQKRIMEVIDEACREEYESLRDEVRKEVRSAANGKMKSSAKNVAELALDREGK